VKAFLESLSLGSGAALIAGVSAGAAWLVGRVRSAAIRWCAAVLVPFALSYCCYWIPVWLGGSRDQHSSWEFLVVGIWFVAGLLVCGVVTYIIGRHATRTI
jgi:ABC-type thiamin/hydroxymethylpyrimidine transport system permease subunit